MNNLDIKPVCSPDLPSFLSGLEKGDYNFAFVSSKYSQDCISAWGKRSTPIQLVIMAKLGEISAYNNTGSILLPVYANTLANVLNGIIDGGRGLSYEHIYFTAPSIRILIVDDLETNLRVAAGLMAPYKMEIDTCLSGYDAIEMIRTNAAAGKAYDLVFMDHMMPGMDGVEAAARIRDIDKNDKYYRDLPIIMLTANALSGHKEKFLQNGINDFLAKPIEMKKLNFILEKWLPLKSRIPLGETNSLTYAPGASGDDAEEIPEIAGVNSREGLQHIGGSLADYMNILSVFRRDVIDRIGEIRESAATEDLTRYTILVHAMKSACRSIGAAELGSTAEDLEDAGNNRNLKAIADKTSGFLEQLQVTIESISAVLDQYSGERTEGADLSTLKLNTLKEALIAFDIESVNQFIKDCMNAPMNAKTREFLRAIEQYILLFEYEKAIECIDAQLQ
jgi:CheY-like chemotaxis protein